MSSDITITVLNWEKYNPRNDSKRPTWFRVDNDLATGPGFFSLDCEQKWLWIVILSLVSQKNGEPIVWNAAYVESISGIKERKQFQTIEIFEKFARLRVSRKNLPVEKYLSSQVDPATYERTNVQNERTLVEAARVRLPSFDFESLYKKYPRKLGKATGIQRLTKMVTTEEDFKNLDQAIQNYAAHCASKGTEEKYIKHFDSFVGTQEKQSWRDWIDYKFDPLEKPKRDYSFLLECEK